MSEFRIERNLYGFSITAVVTQLDQDIHILLTGGCLSHIGAVSMYEHGRQKGFFQLAGHKDGIVGSRWAEEISVRRKGTVTVACGIHYNHATRQMLQEIMKVTDEMLSEAVKIMNNDFLHI